MQPVLMAGERCSAGRAQEPATLSFVIIEKQERTKSRSVPVISSSSFSGNTRMGYTGQEQTAFLNCLYCENNKDSESLLLSCVK